MEHVEFKEKIKNVLDPKGWLEGPDETEFYVTEWRKLWRGHCIGVALPESTEQVASIVKICAEARIPITPQGGNTGLVGGGVPYGGIVLSTRRLNAVRGIDAVNQTMTIEAGCILANIHILAAEADLFFPLSLGAEGTCQIGGNLSTNAGGVGVLRYGNARDLVLGLEVVLPNGDILTDLNGLRKDNTGYDLKQLFMGAEGTLGIITAATLKLFPSVKSRQTAFIALPGTESALDVFSLVQNSAADFLTAFEILNDTAYKLVQRHIPNVRSIFPESHAHYALIEFTSPVREAPLRSLLETCLSNCFDSGLIEDAVLAETEEHSDHFWRIRESIPESQVLEGKSVKHDISVPVSQVATLVQQASQAVYDILPDVRIVCFGHMGDGNLHFNLSQPVSMDGAIFLEMWGEFNTAVHKIAVDLGGSFSAEHGIGTLKRNDLVRLGSPIAIDLMRSIKSTIDPDNTMNPGKTIPDI